jgi:ADP-heptose:LPS heptosyltransferase
LTGSPEVYGFSVHNQYRDSLYTKSFKKEFNDHEIYDFYNVFSLWVDLERSSQLELNETSLGIQQAKLLFEQYGINIKNGPPIVLIHPGCGDDGLPREWPLTLYAVFCHWLINKFQAKIILTSGPEESKKTHDLNKLINKKAIDLGGKLSIEAIISVIKKADMVVSGNTGVMHMAAALRKKQIAIHGPTNPIIWGPLNPHSKIVMSPCPNCPCLKLGFEYHTKDQSCMRKIDVEQVKNAFIELMKMEIK